MKVNVTATRCIVENDVELNAGEYNINKFYFEFSPEYLDNYVKKALFVAKDKPPIEMVIVNDECDIPYDILKKPGTYMFGVYAYEVGDNDELILRYSPEPTHFYVNRGSYIENTETPTEPDPDEFAQYYQAMQELVANAKPEFKEYIDENLPTVEIGEVTTLTPGSQATVTNSGTDRNPIFNFGIPEGLKGDSVGAIEIDSNNETYQIKMKLYDDNGQTIAESNTIDLPIENKVDKINGKSLSTNDFTDELKNKLDNVEDYAEVNVIQTISKNGTPITVEDKNVNIVVPTNTSDLNNNSGFITSEVDDLENYYNKTVSDNKFALITESGKIIDLSIDNSTYVMTITLKDRDANVLSSSDVDLPLETMVINASYDSNTKEIVLTLKNGNTTRFSVAGLVSGLQSEITSTNKLKSDLVDDNKQTNKFVTLNEKTTWNNKSDFSGSYNDLTDVPTIPTQLDELSDDSTHRLVTDDEKSTWNGKQDKINDLETIRSGAASGKTAVQFNDLATVATSGSYNDLSNKPTIPTKLSQLSDDSAHRLVSDTEKTTWNNKSDFSGSYNDLSNKPTIPTNTSQLTNNSNFVSDGNYVHTDNNYTNTEKQKLANLENYDDTEIRESINDLDENKADKTEIPENTSDLNNDNGFITKNVNDLTYYTLKTSTGSLIDLEINQTTYVVTLKLKDIDGNLISSDSIDLPLENVVVSGSYDDSSQKIILTLQNGTTVDIPVGDLVAGLQTEITSSNKIASDLVDDSNSGNKFVTTSEKSTWNGKQNAITSSNKLSASLVSGLATVATSGSYNDLTDTPTIPTQVTESTVSGWGFTKNTGTITGVKMNGTTVASSGVADLGTVITEHQDISGKQDALVSGTNIKTINNQSLLGSGNITVEGGGGTVDTAMSDSSTNAVQNKVIKGYVDDIVGDIGTILDSINGEVIGG